MNTKPTKYKHDKMQIRQNANVRKCKHDKIQKQAGAELGQAQQQLGFGCRLARKAAAKE